ncbi:hypothetical protein Vretimale_9925 [Volvox reticuliferus]|uniref:Uncharacterized protein n=1 Tax=Volvox reticuliferus TaxID=1737510 RepID=A0A8J4CR73_9CHLO|nr:hypothetical protein Vretifemale_13689 [Volvox reticuliferus]GIM05428.1 hypothetical protein Vretimale_9925 [Volvox reticuliferus]
MASTFAQSMRAASAEFKIYRPNGRQQRLQVVCLGSPAPTSARTQSSRTVPQSLASTLQMHSPTGPGFTSWMSMLEMFFNTRKSTESWSFAEISDFNYEDDGEGDNAAAHMYTSHLADRLAMQPLGDDDS